MLRVMFDEVGEAEVLKLVEAEIGAPADGELSLSVRAAGLNRFEALFRRDAYAVSPILPSAIGAEGVGIVEAIGADVSDFKVGDRVTVLPTAPAVGTGMYATRANVPAESVIRAIDGSTDQEEAALWCAYLTAYGILTESSLKAGSHVLVTAAASSVGLALIQVARDMGAIPIATSRTPEKRDALLALGAEHVIVTDERSVAEAVAEITNGVGVAIAADALAGRFLADVVAATAAGGAVRVYGTLAETRMVDARVDLPLFALFGKTLTFASIYAVLFDMARKRQAEDYIREAFARGTIRPQVDRVFKLDQVIEAHRYLERGGQIGKVLLSM